MASTTLLAFLHLLLYLIQLSRLSRKCTGARVLHAARCGNAENVSLEAGKLSSGPVDLSIVARGCCCYGGSSYHQTSFHTLSAREVWIWNWYYKVGEL